MSYSSRIYMYGPVGLLLLIVVLYAVFWRVESDTLAARLERANGGEIMPGVAFCCPACHSPIAAAQQKRIGASSISRCAEWLMAGISSSLKPMGNSRWPGNPHPMRARK